MQNKPFYMIMRTSNVGAFSKRAAHPARWSKTISLILLLCIPMIAGFDQTNDDEIILLPITMKNGYGPFSPGFGLLRWQEEKKPDNPWFNCDIEVDNLPEHWQETSVDCFWFDAHQFVYQNYHQGNLTGEFFENLKVSWGMDMERAFSKEPIKCYTHIAMGKTAIGETEIMIDANNDHDFSDEALVVPAPGPIKGIKNPEFTEVKIESLHDHQVVEFTTAIAIFYMGEKLLINVPQYAEAALEGQKISISFDFHNLSFEQTILCLNDDANNLVEIDNYFEIDGQTYQNLGVDFNRQVLQLKKINHDDILYSAQIGYHAIPFAGKEFTTGDSIKLDYFRGKYVYLDFWGSWCGPCRHEIPNMKKAYSQLDTARFAMLGVAFDKPDKLKKAIDELEVEWPQIISHQQNDICGNYNIVGYPTTYLLDPDGKIIAKNLRGENLLDTLQTYLD